MNDTVRLTQDDEAILSVDVSDEAVEREYFFPEHGKVVSARSTDDAQAKLAEQLKAASN